MARKSRVMLSDFQSRQLLTLLRVVAADWDRWAPYFPGRQGRSLRLAMARVEEAHNLLLLRNAEARAAHSYLSDGKS